MSSVLHLRGLFVSGVASASSARVARFSSPNKKKNYVSSVLMEDREAKPIDLVGGFLAKKPYNPPSWASHLNPIPTHIYSLGHLPTPIHKWNVPNLPDDTEIWIKRDDLSGMQLSGNKVRKLEFLLSDAVAHGADCVITVGGIQSNHCRATAVAARYLNIDCYLILRTSKTLVDKDPGLTGNLLVERLVGAKVELVSKEEYADIGSVALADLLKERLISEGRKPYVIPVGGSNSLGSCLTKQVHAFSVCDDPDYFYNYCQGLLDGLQAGVDMHNIVNIQDAKGLGYAISTAEELQFVKDTAAETGVILDPVYSGKAAYALLKDISANPTKWKGRKILFIHTGGLLGLFDKFEQLAPILIGNWGKMELGESIPRKDGIGKMF
ncbi:hypothetical protein KFK09_013842 [Dendrobium nobile]|uniref:Tryptophan synthase beta chain-like PALP domain-containing protein n=1 Tax=Dendrobium nobile TaxID=94219 RepID=A0A8T3BA22_DENNO|nr:hypothetical protein KFK09_013842 [Dendrobium nobile]